MNRRRALVSALRTLLLCGALSAVSWTALAATAGASQTTAATSAGGGFVGRSGAQLTLGGQPWKFAGYNLPCANPFDLPAAALDYYLDDIQNNSGANVIRVWFFQSDGGPGNWAPFDQVISALRARGMKAIVTLTNETSTCDEPSLPANTYKTAAWYQKGYLSAEGGYARSFRAYAVAVAKHFANNPGVAFWQLVNEAQAPTLDSGGQLTCDETAATQALRGFADHMVTAIRKVDHHHLVDLGTEGIGQCGMQNPTDYSYIHAGNVDLCEYHDYGSPATDLPSGMAEAIAACSALGKPFFVGESGIPANVGADGQPNSACDPWPSCSPDPITITTLDQRASFFAAKISAANAAHVAGYVIWVKSPFYSDTTDGYAIADGDPTEAVLQTDLDTPATLTAAPAQTPEFPLMAAPILVAGAVFGVAVWVRRRRAAPSQASSG